MKNKKVLFCDLDGVVFNFALGFSKIFKNQICSNYELVRDNSKIQDWDWSKWYATPEHVDEAWKILRHTENFWESLQTLDVEGLWALNSLKRDVDIYFVTMRTPSAGYSPMVQSYNALKDFGFTAPNVIVTEKKLELIEVMNPNFYLDDCPKYFRSPEVFKRMDLVSTFDYPYTKDVVSHIPRVSSLSEFVTNMSQYI